MYSGRRCQSRPAAISSQAFVTPRCGGEEPEPRQAPFKLPHHRRGRAEREKAQQGEKATARRD